MSLDDAAICARAGQRCKELGRSQREVLKTLGFAHDYLQTTPRHGRRVDRLDVLAEELQMSLASLLGLPMTSEFDIEIFVLAYEATPTAMEFVTQPNARSFVETMLTIYTLLLSRQADGHDPEDPEYLKQIVDILRTRSGVASSRRRR